MNVINKVRGLSKKEEGSTLVEFGILAGPLLILIMGAMDLGYQAYLNMMTQSISHRVAREAVTGRITFEQVEDRANELLRPVLLRNASVEVETSSYFDFRGIGQPENITADANGNGVVEDGDCFEDVNNNAEYDLDIGNIGLGSSDDVVTYTINVDSPRLLPTAGLIGFSDRLSISGSSASRNQPFGTQDAVIAQQYCVIGGSNVLS